MAIIESGKHRPSLIELVGPTNPNAYNPNRYKYAGSRVHRPTEDVALEGVYDLTPEQAFACRVITPQEKRYLDVVQKLGIPQGPGRPKNKDRVERQALFTEKEQLEKIHSERR